MKLILKQLLKIYLKYVTKIALFVHRPTVIAIAGSINKTFVKEEVKRAIERQGINVCANPKNFNTEIGLPLAVLGLKSGYNSFSAWWPIIVQAPAAIFKANFPKYLVLGLGTSDPGDMKYLLTIVKPDIAVIGDLTQRYLEGFPSMDGLVNEYEVLAKKLPKEGLLILNYDNSRIREIAKVADCKLIFYGFEDGADWQAIDYKKTNDGQTVTIKRNGETFEMCQKRFGEHHVFAILVGLIINSYVKEEQN